MGLILSKDLYERILSLSPENKVHEHHHHSPVSPQGNINKACFSLKLKKKIVYPLNSDFKDRSDWMAYKNEHLQARFLNSPDYPDLPSLDEHCPDKHDIVSLSA